MEPLNALAFEQDGVFEIHTGNQWQSLALPTLAKALGRPEASIVMRTYMLGGGFGRRLNGDYAVPAALAAKELRRPVKLVLTRADDARFDSVRSPSVQKLRMAFAENGRVTGMEHHAAAGWPTLVMAPAAMSKGQGGKPFDQFSINGANHWYDVGAQQVRAITNDLANATFRPGWLRSVAPGWTNWASESFIDEAAHHVGADPLAFRLGLLTGAGLNAGGAPETGGGARRQAEVVRARPSAPVGEPAPAGFRTGASDHLRAGARHAYLDRVRRARTGRSRERRGEGREADAGAWTRARSSIRMARRPSSRARRCGVSAWRCTRAPGS